MEQAVKSKKFVRIYFEGKPELLNGQEKDTAGKADGKSGKGTKGKGTTGPSLVGGQRNGDTAGDEDRSRFLFSNPCRQYEREKKIEKQIKLQRRYIKLAPPFHSINLQVGIPLHQTWNRTDNEILTHSRTYTTSSLALPQVGTIRADTLSRSTERMPWIVEKL